MSHEQLVVFDLDDTLVDTSDVYWRAREYFVGELVGEGIDPEVAVEEFEAVDSVQIKNLGFSPLRYGKSMAMTHDRLLKRLGRTPSEETRSRIEVLGRYVLDHLPEPIDGAHALLEWAADNFELALLTRGDDRLQRRKVEHADFSKYFSAVRVVSEKDSRVLEEVIHDVGYPPQRTWVVGDSVRSDINPGIEVGAKCILYLYRHHVYHWRQEHGDKSVGPFVEASTLHEVKNVLQLSLQREADTHS